MSLNDKERDPNLPVIIVFLSLPPPTRRGCEFGLEFVYRMYVLWSLARQIATLNSTRGTRFVSLVYSLTGRVSGPKVLVKQHLVWILNKLSVEDSREIILEYYRRLRLSYPTPGRAAKKPYCQKCWR